MSSFYELIWRENELDSYSTDKLNFIFNTINHPFPIRYRQMYANRLEWQKAVNHHNNIVKKVKDTINSRNDIHNVRKAWLKQHNNVNNVRKAWLKQHNNVKAVAENGYTIEQVANELPHLANQLGAFIEIENIEIKYFDDELKPRYDLNDFEDISKQNYPSSGFNQTGITKEKFLKLYPQVSNKNLDKVLLAAEYEPKNDTDTTIPYWFAVNAKRMLVDGDSFANTFDD